MSLVVNNNLMAANVARNLNAHYGRLQTSTQRLSSGLRINSAADDAAGLAIRELQRADIAAFHQGARNANDAVSMIQVADGALGVIDEKLIRMKELAEQAATGTYDSTQRLMIESEYQAMASEITRIANATDFNGIKLLDGTLDGDHDGSGLTATGKMKVHFGTGNDSAEDYYYITVGECTAQAFGVGNASTWQDVQRRGMKAFEDSFRKQINNSNLSSAEKSKLHSQLSDISRAVDAALKNATEPNNAYQYWSADDPDAATRAAGTDEGFLVDGKVWKGGTNLLNDFLSQGENSVMNDPDVKLKQEAYDTAKSVYDKAKSDYDTAKAANDELTAATQAQTEAAAALNLAKGELNVAEGAQQTAETNLERAEQDKTDAENAVTKYQSDYTTAYKKYIDDNGFDANNLTDQQKADAEATATTAAEAAAGNKTLADLEQAKTQTTEAFNQGQAAKDAADKAVAEKTQLVDEKTVAKAEADARQKVADDAVKALNPDLTTAEGNLTTAQTALTTATAELNAAKAAATANGAVDLNAWYNGLRPSEQQRLQYAWGQAAIYNLANGNPGIEPAQFGIGAKFDGIYPGLDDLDTEAGKMFQQALKDMQAKVGNMDFAGYTVETQEAAQMAIEAINNAIVAKDKIRAHLGATQNRLENTVTNINVMAENLQAAESRISDVDVATEMTQFVRNQILTQSAVAMLAQANSLPQMAMQLIGG